MGIVLDLKALMPNEQYDLGIIVEDRNYTYSISHASTLNILDSSVKTNITWDLYAYGSSLPLLQYRKYAELDERDIISEDDLSYDATTFRYEVDLPDGYTLDETFEDYGYLIEKLNGSGDGIGCDAGTYKTSIRLKENNNIYSITWTISKAKFDLSDVKWKYDGKIPFSTAVSDMKCEIDADTLPKGLEVNLPYIGINSGNKVGDKDTATVSFAFDTSDPSYAINYELPTQNGNNYIFNGSGDFEWSKDWEIVKMQIALNWKLEDAIDVNGEKYQRQTLVEDKRVVDYEYYVWDMATNQPIGNALSEADIEVEENVAKYYVTKAVIKSTYANNVEFSGTNVYSQPFTVGVNATAVEVTLVSNTLTYNGNAQSVRLRISGALSESDFDIVYYDKDGTTPLEGAPKNAGKYRVEISLKSGVEGFYLDGINVSDGVAVIEYEIKPMSIDGSESNWTDVRKPPSLQINKKQLAGIE
ncbi:MAG: hypothetical protein K2N53_06225, partial [Clostridia bacterium]|nr:hypothetical protein [Clostridia bacterium]